ncbi:MAG: TetR/AcrR family transcriptional regulator [Thermoleophilaceae bacterium]
MSEMASRGGRAKRADAQRSIARVLDAALTLLPDRPDASMGDIARAAGVARQTVYAHFDSRESLLVAVAGRALEQAVEAIDAAEPDTGPPAAALERLTRAWWDTVQRRARVLHALAGAFPHAEGIHDFHTPILSRVERLVRRGRRSGDFASDVPVGWLATSFLAVMHAAADDVAAGRMKAEAAGDALERTVPRLFGVRC